MAYSSALHWAGATGEHAKGEGAQYTAVYRVTTDDAQDQAQSVINWFRDNVVEIGSLYAYAGDTGDTVAKCKRIRAEREANSTTVWMVTVSYDSQEDKPEEGEDENGDPTDNPLEFRPVLSMNTVHRSKVAERVKFLGGYQEVANAKIGVNSLTVPMNSAYVPFQPGLEREFTQCQLNIIRNLAVVDAQQLVSYADAVNSSQITIQYRGFGVIVGERVAKITGWRTDLRLLNNVEFWETQCGMLLDPDSWVEQIADRGLHASLNPGDPDGKGGYVSPGDPDFEANGIPRLRRLLDKDGMPLTTPVLLNGAGQPLPIPEDGQVAPVYGRWLKYSELEFRNIAFFNGVIF